MSKRFRYSAGSSYSATSKSSSIASSYLDDDQEDGTVADATLHTVHRRRCSSISNRSSMVSRNGTRSSASNSHSRSMNNITLSTNSTNTANTVTTTTTTNMMKMPPKVWDGKRLSSNSAIDINSTNAYSSTEILRFTALDSYNSVFDKSNIPDKSDAYPKFDKHEVHIGKLLGHGGFANVYEICGFTLKKDFVVPPPEIPPFPSSLETKNNNNGQGGDDGNSKDPTAATTNDEDEKMPPPLPTLEEQKSLHVGDEDYLIDKNDDTPFANVSSIDMKLYEQRQHASRQFLSDHCFRKPTCAASASASADDYNDAYYGDGKSRYALKRLKPAVLADPQVVIQGISDMATESRFLASLEYHPHIVKLRGMGIDKFNQDYFLIMDRLGQTLEQRMDKVWFPRKQKQRTATSRFISKCVKRFKRSNSGGNSNNNNKKNNTNSNTNKEQPSLTSDEHGKEKFKLHRKWKDDETIVPRLLASYGIASALAHLHKHRILYRDLKPANCGFDVREDIKIFDFGLAKEWVLPTTNTSSGDEQNGNNNNKRINLLDIDEQKPVELPDGTVLYHFTAMCGTPRYMAPEVALGEPYNQSCDVYSFAILCWQIFKLKKPYGTKCSFDLLKRAWSEGDTVRPEIPFYWPLAIREMLSKAWSCDISKRPTMKSMQQTLKKQLQILTSRTMDDSQKRASRGEAENSSTLLLLEQLDDASKRMDTTRRRSTHVFKNGRGMGKSFDGQRHLSEVAKQIMTSPSFRGSDRSLVEALSGALDKHEINDYDDDDDHNNNDDDENGEMKSSEMFLFKLQEDDDEKSSGEEEGGDGGSSSSSSSSSTGNEVCVVNEEQQQEQPPKEEAKSTTTIATTTTTTTDSSASVPEKMAIVEQAIIGT